MASLEFQSYKPPNYLHLPQQVFSWGALYHDDQVEHAALERVAREMEAAIEALQRLSGLIVRRPVHLVLDASCSIPRSYPLNTSPLIMLPGDQAPGNTSWVAGDLVHELAHILLFAPRSRLLSEGWAVACAYLLTTDNRFPLAVSGANAFHEATFQISDGLDQTLDDYMEGRPRRQDLLVSDAPHQGNQLAYAQAGSFVLHLIESHGIQHFIRAVQILEGEPRLTEEQALQEVYGHTLRELEAEWRQRFYRPSADGQPARPAPLQLSDTWTLLTDRVLQGDSVATVIKQDGALVVSGRMGSTGPLQIVSLHRSLSQDGACFDASMYTGIRFEARGDGKNYHVWLSTQAANQPGKEFMYFFATSVSWQQHEVLFARFQCFTNPPPVWTGKDVMAIGVRAFGYASQSIEIGIRAVELY